MSFNSPDNILRDTTNSPSGATTIANAVAANHKISSFPSQFTSDEKLKRSYIPYSKREPEP